MTRLFNPREDVWSMHFRFDESRAEILGLSDIGLVTCRMLGFNHDKRVAERMQMILASRYPSPEAISHHVPRGADLKLVHDDDIRKLV